MCLSTVYKGEQKPENIVLTNVQRIECQPGQVLLTDLMERQAVVVGELVSVDLVNNVAIVRETANV
jgi:predicted RNA-binding protein